jgi:hypothetical protein
MIFLIFLYLSFFSRPWNTFALPTELLPPQNFPRNHLESIFIRDESRFGTRSIYGILWSCLSTIFTCTWITVHPNIPAPGDSQWSVLRRRVAIMAYILLAPEMVIVWAGRQHYAACHFAKKHQENTGWTRAHAFFLIMGGFTLHEGGKPVRVLEARELEELSEAGKIVWPTITEEEIADRSKGDYLSKTIVLFQTTWFIGQCIARGAYGLDVTELEVVTLAFATLTGVIYYFWWDKPLDVRCSIPVQLLEGHVGKEDSGSQIISPLEVSAQEKEGDEKIDVLPNPLPSTPIQVDKSIPDPALTSTGSHVVPPQEVPDQGMPKGDENVVVNSDPLPSTSIQVDTSTPDPALTRMERFQAFRRRARMKHGTLFGTGYVFIVFPLERFFGAFSDMLNCETVGDKTLRVPTFYSPPDEGSDIALLLGVCVSIVFGAIHCIAWSFHFATLPERWAWRISAILVSGLPIVIVAFSGLLTIFDKKENKTTGMELYEDVLSFILMGMSCLYIIARIALLVLPFMALRALLPGAYVQLNWVSFLPHI